MTDPTATAAPKAGRRGWIGLAVLALPCMLYSMDLTVLNLAVPSLSAHLAPTSAQLLWIVDIYGFLVAGALISETCSELGGALGIAILGSIGAALYRGAMADAVPPGVPLEAAEAARATLGGALAVAAQLPEQAGAALRTAAREAFTQGLQMTAVVSAVTVAATAVAATVLARGARQRAPMSPSSRHDLGRLEARDPARANE
jgi:hypothetical protein